MTQGTNKSFRANFVILDNVAKYRIDSRCLKSIDAEVK
jgi:hypothetical protein